MNKDRIMLYLQKELDKCNKHYHSSYDTATRYKWSERADMFEMLMRAVNCYEQLSQYIQLDHKCREKYGVNIASYLNL